MPSSNWNDRFRVTGCLSECSRSRGLSQAAGALDGPGGVHHNLGAPWSTAGTASLTSREVAESIKQVG
jgi:hypothetical protein